MATLQPDLFMDVFRWLAPHVPGIAERKTLLARWRTSLPRWTALEWEGSADVFTTRLILELPEAMLVEVLRSVVVGVDQRPVVEALCARIDPVGVMERSGPLPAFRAGRSRLPDGVAPVLFERLSDGAPTTVATIAAVWDAGAPLALVTDCPADTSHALAALTGTSPGRTALWLDGESLFLPDDAKAAAGDAHIGEAADLVLDFSACRPDGKGDVDPARAATLLRALLRWASTHRRRIVIGLPRYLTPLVDLSSCRVHRTAPLFATGYEHRVTECERLLGSGLPVPEILGPLLRANSATLPGAVAGLLVDRKPRHSDSELDLVRLARGLTDAGFYEIAFRLEMFCRSRPDDGRVIAPLAADLWFAERSEERDTVGFAASVLEVPARMRWAVITGPSGCGKTTSLMGIEHEWSLPRVDAGTPRAAAFLPLRLSLDTSPDGDGDPGLGHRIDGHVSDEEFGWLEHHDQRVELACHTLVRRLGSIDAVRELFGSPLLLLLDDADHVPAGARERIHRELTTLRGAAGAAVLLAASWRPGGFGALGEVRLRPFDEEQVDLVIRQRRAHLSLLDLLVAHGRPISRYVRHPQLLALLCSLDVTAEELWNADLRSIVERYLVRRAAALWRGAGPALGVGRQPGWAAGPRGAELARWLAGAAFEMLVSRQGRVRAGTADEQALAAQARLIEVLRPHSDPGVVEFTCSAVRDYLAAQHLAREVGESGSSSLESRLGALDADDWAAGEWRDVCLILITLLSEKDAGNLVNLLLGSGQRQLAHECALELPIGHPATAVTVQALADSLRTPAVDDSGRAARIEEARSLGALDPRLTLDDPLSAMEEIPGSGRLPAFLIGRYPVTVLEYQEFIRSDGYRDRDLWSDTGWRWVRQQRAGAPRFWRNAEVSRPNHPVTGVTFHEAGAYCAWLSRRHPGLVFSLPTASEWERGAHGDDRVGDLLALAIQPFCDPGVSIELAERLRHITVAAGGYVFDEIPVPVGLSEPNSAGVHDLLGALWQWCGTSMEVLSATERRFVDIGAGSAVAGGARIVVKGGGGAVGADPVSILTGGWFDPSVRFHRLGFRVICRPGVSGQHHERK
jgi:formylglycine-generating enzyme required for sulfatase activity